MGVNSLGGPSNIGASSATQRASTLNSIGSTLFSAALTGGSIAAGAFGGPAAGSAVSSFGSAIGGSAFGSSNLSGGGANDEIGQITGQIGDDRQSTLVVAGQEAVEGQSDTADLMRLQQAINLQSQTNTMITNMQKARHDAQMATIQNAR